MKKIICVLFSALFAVPFSSSVRAAEKASDKPGVSASAYVLYCPQNGQVILANNENKRKKPASTTKLMTSLITLEKAAKGNINVTFTAEMTAEGSSMYLECGDTVKLSDLASGMMMCSGNDAANAAAIAVSGSKEKFSVLMNERAKKIGMKNTHFVTPSGLDDDSHYSTAYDMALLMAEVLKNTELADLISQKSATVNFVNPGNKHMIYSNHNRLLSLYPDCIGGKTGYTTAAGRCLVTAAKRGNLTLICVTLDDKNDWNDHIALYDYGFSNFGCYKDDAFKAKIPVAGGEEEYVNVGADSGVELVLPTGSTDKVRRKIKLDSFLFAPVRQGGIVGEIEYSLDGKTLCRKKLAVSSGTEFKKVETGFFGFIKEMFADG